MTEVQTTEDGVIARARSRLAADERALGFSRRKLEEARHASLRPDGGIRRGFAEQAAGREQEVSLREQRVKAAKAKLEAAVADLPRRVKEREQAAELERQILASDTRLRALQNKVAAEESTARELRERHLDHLAAAGDAKRRQEEVAA